MYNGLEMNVQGQISLSYSVLKQKNTECIKQLTSISCIVSDHPSVVIDVCIPVSGKFCDTDCTRYGRIF